MTASDVVVLLDADAGIVGQMDKLEAHRRPTRHLAFSVVLRDARGAMVLQRRAGAKYHFGGRWSNACCSHPRPGEPVTGAGRRRVREELGIDCGPLTVQGAFWYTARDPESGLAEHEYDVVLVGSVDVDLPQFAYDPAEVEGLTLVHPADLRATLAEAPQLFTPWLAAVLDVVDASPAPVAAGLTL